MKHMTSAGAELLRFALLTLLCLSLTTVSLHTARAQTLTPLHSFDADPYHDGGSPVATLTLASDGNFYGTTTGGGTFDAGAVFRLSPTGAITTIHSFHGADGSVPYGKLLQATDGYLYGATNQGGDNGYGNVFKMTLGGAVTSIYSFTNHADGSRPYSGVIQGSDGKLYGTTSQGGVPPAGQSAYGTVYRLTTAGALTTLYTFVTVSGNYTSGQQPTGGVAQASDGNLYGTTSLGGGATGAGSGTVFKLTLGTTPALTTLHVFTGTGTDGAFSYTRTYGSLVQASDGSLYGTTPGGGAGSAGVVFRITTGGSYATIYSFVQDSSYNYTRGLTPLNGLLQAPDGGLYGTTSDGGTAAAGARAKGTVFRITTGGTLSTLYSFHSVTGDTSTFPQGFKPLAGLALSASGDLYGTTYEGGVTTDGSAPRDLGTVFKITTGGTFTLLDAFTNGILDGRTPYGKVIQASDGYFYGTTSKGGLNGYGVIYRADAAGKIVILHNFDRPDGVNPMSGLLEAADGNLYGTASSGGANYAGTVYRMSKTGAFSVLYSFAPDADNNYPNGQAPIGGLIQASDGALYGTTSQGGTPPAGGSARGTLFKITTGGTLTTLYTFGSASSDGATPEGELFQAADGALYGTTSAGGAIGVTIQQGTLFRLTLGTTPTLTPLHTFTGKNGEGANPAYGSLVQTADGTLYGVTQNGGTYGVGTAFLMHTDGTAFATLRSFGEAGGSYPTGGVLLASDGILYGTASAGGEYDHGTVFRLTTSGLLTTLYSFGPYDSTGYRVNADGAIPYGGLIQADDGLLYGAASVGGAVGYGSLFSMNVQFPTLTKVSPNSGGVGATITLTGTNFAGASGVSFHGTPAAFTVLSPTHMTAVVPSGATTGRITVYAPGGNAVSRSNFTVLSTPAPALVSFSPRSGAPGTLVQIAGTNFTGVTAVMFGGVPAASFLINSDSLLTAVVPSGAVSGPLSASGPGGLGVSLPSFTVTASNAPAITGFSPASGPVGTLVQINGAGFNAVSAVAFHGAAASYSVNSENQITALVPVGATTGTITVTTFDGTATSASSFTVSASAPTISGFSPTSGPVGTLVAINGTNLAGATGVKFHGASARFTAGSATQITATVPAGATTGTITVTTPNGTATSAAGFTVSGTTPPAPTLTGFTPTSGPVGTSVTLTGTNFTGATGVTFNGTAATTYTVNSATQITATVPSGATSGTISVTTPGGTATSANAFTVTTTAGGPTITSFTPTSARVGKTVSIAGTGFLSATAVKFNGTAATTYTINRDTQITATIPAGATTGPISVTTPGGTATSADTFTVTVSAPTITSFTPASGPVGTGVTITGTNLTGTTAVKFHGVAATFTLNSSTQITATVPTGATTGTLTVTTPGGTATSAASFTVTTSGGPVVPQSLTCSPNPVAVDGVTTGTVTLSGPAPAGGATVSIASGGTAFTSATIAAGATTGTFGAYFNSAGTYTLSASYNGASVSTSLTVQATSVTLASYTFNPNPVTGGQTTTATVTLSAAAPAGGAYVIINYNGSQFYQVLVPQGQTSATYTESTNAVTTTTSYTYSAVYNGATRTATLTVTP